MLPRLVTARLVLDAFTLEDVPTVVELCQHPEVYATTLRIERPYQPEHAIGWISGHLSRFLQGAAVNLAIRAEGRLVGSVSLDIERASDSAVLGYYMGRPYWGRGYATEAVRAMVAYGFQECRLEKITADHFAGNAASGRVLEKAGFSREGLRQRHYKKDGVFIDAVLHGLTRPAALAAGSIREDAPSAPPQPSPPPAGRSRTAEEPPWAEELAATGTGSVDRSLLQRHFLGKNIAALEEELRVYGKSLAPDFAHLSPIALGYYLHSAQRYLESEFSEGDWDFAHGLTAALAPRLRDGGLDGETQTRAQALLRHIRDQAARYFIEPDQQPFAGWLSAALTD